MRIAFISANREQLPDAVIPLGILSVMAATPARHEKLFWDLCFDRLQSVASTRVDDSRRTHAMPMPAAK